MYPNGSAPQPPNTPPPQPGGTPPVPPPSSPQPYPQQNPSYGYGPQPEPTYAVDYLDQIAPPPPQAKFLSGSFGKIVVILGVIFVFTVGIIVALSNQKNTASLESMTVKLDQMETVVKQTQVNLKSGTLKATNSNFDIWMQNTDRDGYTLLGEAGVRKSAISKKTTADEKAAATALTNKFEDARLNAELDRVYAREMAYQATLIKTDFDKMAKTGPAKKIRDWAKTASTNLVPIQQAFANFDDTGTN